MPVERRRRLSSCHGSKFSGSQQTIGSINSRCSGKWARTFSGKIKHRARETAEIEPKQTVVLADKKNEKIDIDDFPVHDCIQEQNGSPSFDNANGRLYIVFVDKQKFYCHGNVT